MSLSYYVYNFSKSFSLQISYLCSQWTRDGFRKVAVLIQDFSSTLWKVGNHLPVGTPDFRKFGSRFSLPGIGQVAEISIKWQDAF